MNKFSLQEIAMTQPEFLIRFKRELVILLSQMALRQ